MSSYTNVTVIAPFSTQNVAAALDDFASSYQGSAEVETFEGFNTPFVVSATFNHVVMDDVLSALRKAAASTGPGGGDPYYVPVAVTEHHENAFSVSTHLLDTDGGWHTTSAACF